MILSTQLGVNCVSVVELVVSLVGITRKFQTQKSGHIHQKKKSEMWGIIE